MAKSGVWAVLWALWALTLVMMATPLFAADAPAAVNPQTPFQVTFSDAEDAVARALIAKGVAEKVAASMNGQRSAPLYSYSAPLTVETRGLQFDKLTHRWSGSLLLKAASGDVITALPAAGRFEEMIEVPVLKREVHAGDIIGATDVEVHDFPLTHTRTDTITDMSGLIGKTPVRGISPERPIREAEVQAPPLVKKNDIVQMRFATPAMTITAAGQALQEGARGDVIEVRNTASKKIVRASVEDQNTVNILAPGTQVSQMTGGSYAAN